MDLNPEDIIHNPGRRYVAKLCLNSFWGKFAQRADVTKSTMVSDPKDFFQFIMSEKETVHELIFLNDEIVELRHKTQQNFLTTLPTSNLVIAAFTTASARLKLLKALNVVGDRAIYMDTDSIVYISREDMANPEEGNALGELQSELHPDEIITEFVAAGAKNYGYKTNQGVVKMKVRGFTQNDISKKSLNFVTVKNLIGMKEQGEKKIEVQMGTTIKRDIKTKKLFTGPNTKNYRVVFDKRVMSEHRRTRVPFGYVGRPDLALDGW